MTNIISQLTKLVSQHIGDEHLKKIYAISLLSMSVRGVEEPLHLHVFGDRESGKTDLQTRFLDIVPEGHKDIASDFSPRVLLYANLNPATIISMNDKIFTDSMCGLLNQITDSTGWRLGRTIAVTIGKERVNLFFPPRTIFWVNSNRQISQYNIKEVEPDAVESRFMTFEKKYTDDQKKNIFVNRNFCLNSDDSELESVKNILKEMFKNPKHIICSEEIRNIIWEKSKEMGINSIRQIGRNLTICQVYALISGRTEVSYEDVDNTFLLLKEQFNLKINISETSDEKIAEIIRKELLPEIMFKSLLEEKRILYSYREIQNKIKEDIKSTINYMKSEDIVGVEIIKVGYPRVNIECYYLLEK